MKRVGGEAGRGHLCSQIRQRRRRRDCGVLTVEPKQTPVTWPQAAAPCTALHTGGDAQLPPVTTRAGTWNQGGQGREPCRESAGAGRGPGGAPWCWAEAEPRLTSDLRKRSQAPGERREGPAGPARPRELGQPLGRGDRLTHGLPWVTAGRAGPSDPRFHHLHSQGPDPCRRGCLTSGERITAAPGEGKGVHRGHTSCRDAPKPQCLTPGPGELLLPNPNRVPFAGSRLPDHPAGPALGLPQKELGGHWGRGHAGPRKHPSPRGGWRVSGRSPASRTSLRRPRGGRPRASLQFLCGNKRGKRTGHRDGISSCRFRIRTSPEPTRHSSGLGPPPLTFVSVTAAPRGSSPRGPGLWRPRGSQGPFPPTGDHLGRPPPGASCCRTAGPCGHRGPPSPPSFRGAPPPAGAQGSRVAPSVGVGGGLGTCIRQNSSSNAQERRPRCVRLIVLMGGRPHGNWAGSETPPTLWALVFWVKAPTPGGLRTGDLSSCGERSREAALGRGRL